MKLQLISILLFMTFAGTNVNAQTPDSVRLYIDSALYFMQAKSLYGKDLDWKSISDSAHFMARQASSFKEAFPAIRHAFDKLQDHHGMLASPDTFYRLAPRVNFNESLSPGLKKEFLKGNRIVSATLRNTAYLRVPAMNVDQRQDMDLQASRLRDTLCRLIEGRPRALILDLRMNAGGNSAPMISGLGPVFHDRLLGFGIDRDNKTLEAVTLEDGVLTDERGIKMVTVKRTCLIPKDLPVAVLIGPSTVSSGEILALYLKQQRNIRLFGEPTPGFCNATEGFLFMNNQGYLLLTVNKVADARKRVCEEMLVRPHVHVKSRDNYDNLDEDPTVQAALEWLNKK